MRRLLVITAIAAAGCGGGGNTPELVGLSSFTLSPASLQGGARSTGTLTLSGSAPAGGSVVSLSSSHPSASSPSAVTILEGATSATFTVTTTEVTGSSTATITATYAGATRTATLTVSPPPATLDSLALSPQTVQGGVSASGTVTLTRAAPTGGALVTLSSSIPSAVVTSSVTVASGATSATFAVTTTTVSTTEVATITASHGGVDRTAALTITALPPPPPTLSSVAMSPATAVGGASSTGTVTLTGFALADGATVSLTSSSASASVPGSATVAAGSDSATFTVTTSAVPLDEVVTITATYAGASRTAALTVQAGPCALRTAGAQWLAFSSKRTGVYDIYAMRADGTCLTQVTNDVADDLFVSWSPAGTIAYMSSRSGKMQVYVRDFTSGAEHLLDVGDLTATSPAFSPDGTLVAFEGYEPGVTTISDIYVVPAAGGTPVKRTTGQRYSAGPAWSPDGATLYFVSNRVSGYNVWTVPAAGGTETMLTGTAGILGRPAATPDGTGIAYTLSASGAAFSKVVIQTLSTAAIRIVTAQSDGEPTFDRSGARVVVTSQRGGNADLLLLETASGAVVRQLTTDPGIDGAAAFGPFP